MWGFRIALSLSLLPVAALAFTPLPAVFNAPRDYAVDSPDAVVAADFYGDGSFGIHPTALAAADFNGDLRPDLAVAGIGTGHVAVLLNDGMGRFLAAQPVHSGFEPTLDRGGRLQWGSRGRSGRWQHAPRRPEHRGVSWQRRRDTAARAGDAARGMWGCRWRSRPATSTAMAALDLAVGVELAVLFFRGRGDGRFHLPVSTVVDGSFPRALAAADFNADGHLDSRWALPASQSCT